MILYCKEMSNNNLMKNALEQIQPETDRVSELKKNALLDRTGEHEFIQELNDSENTDKKDEADIEGQPERMREAFRQALEKVNAEIAILDRELDEMNKKKEALDMTIEKYSVPKKMPILAEASIKKAATEEKRRLDEAILSLSTKKQELEMEKNEQQAALEQLQKQLH